MKKILLLIAVAAIVNSCSKDTPSIPSPATAPPISAVPDHFNQKILIENFSQTICGQCPKANLILDSLIRYNSERVYGVTMHVDDPMAVSSLVQSFSLRNYYDSVFNPTALYPSGMINRRNNVASDIYSSMWAYNVMTTLSHIPSCGVALDATRINGNTLTLAVHVGFCANMSGQYAIHAYIVENSVLSYDSTYDQLNDFSSQGTTPDSTLSLYALNDTIHPYSHKYVLRKVATPEGVEGDLIPLSAMVKGNDYLTNYTIDLTGINTSNSYLIVFVDKYATAPNGHWIENVQRVAFGSTKDWN